MVVGAPQSRLGANAWTTGVVQTASSYQSSDTAHPVDRQSPSGTGSNDNSKGSDKKVITDKKDKAGPMSSKREDAITSSRKKRERATQIIEGVLGSVEAITPVESSVLTKVEAASVLWDIDEARSVLLLRSAFKTARELRGDKSVLRPLDQHDDSKERKLWFFVLRKIAAIKPDLVRTLLLENDAGVTPKPLISGEWTDEARAIMGLASEQIEKNPGLAARLAEQSMSWGFADWTSFLEKLAGRDEAEAERVAMTLMDRLRESSMTPIALRNLRRFVFAPGRAAVLQQHFAESVAVRLRRDLVGDIPTSDLEDDLNVSREMSRIAAASSQPWQQDFDALTESFSTLLRARSVPLPDAPRTRMIAESPSVSPAPGDEQAMSDAVARTGMIKDSQIRDEEYEKLAVKASLGDHLSLAEEILSKIAADETRQTATIAVYEPHVRKSINESDWGGAQKEALKIEDPLGRTLVLDGIAKVAARTDEGRSLARDLQDLAAERLKHDWPTEGVAKAFLILEKSIYPVDKERGVEMLTSAIWVLNRTRWRGDFDGHSERNNILAVWVTLANTYTRTDEALDLDEMLAAAFRTVAARDTNVASSVAQTLTDKGLYSRAQLAISRALLDDAKK
jgi:hypothetical protein